MIQPKNDRLLVKVLPSERSSILVGTEDKNSRLIKAQVLAIGPKVKSEICPGECVLITQACREIKSHKALAEDELLIQDADLAGIVPIEACVTDGAPVVSYEHS